MITKPSEHISTDGRVGFKAWAKAIRSQADVDLSAKDGYSLKGGFLDIDKAVALAPGEFLACASETGSRKNRSYTYALVRVSPDGESIVGIDKDERIKLRETALAAEQITEEQAAKGTNSKLYSFALTAWILLDTPAEAAVLTVKEKALVASLKALTPERCALVLAEAKREPT